MGTVRALAARVIRFVVRGQHGLTAVLVLFVVAYLPFLSKPFHMDDPMFLWAARHIRVEPFNFYGFDVNWYGWIMPMWEVMKNPPLASYYMALASIVLGESEAAIHIALAIPAVATLVATARLAKRMGADGAVAAAAAAFSPAFFVSSTTAMCDVLLTCFWTWAALLWLAGFRDERPHLLALSALFASAAALTKYSGVSVVPLLFAYGLAHGRRGIHRTLWLLIPIAVLAGYEHWTGQLYGKGLLLEAPSYSRAVWSELSSSIPSKSVTALVFAGGCCLPLLMLAPLLWSRRALLLACVGVVAITAASVAARAGVKSPWLASAQEALFLVVGVGVVAAAISEARNRQPESLLFALWIAGTLVFAAFLNWTVSTRTMLPLVPAVSVVIARRLSRSAATESSRRVCVLGGTAAAAAVTLLVAFADYTLASAGKEAASRLCSGVGRAASTVWFQGHWGFQHYAEAFGCRPLDFTRLRLNAGDLVVSPANNANVNELPRAVFHPVGEVALDVFPFLSTMSAEAGSGFYSDMWGRLPFALGRVPPETYRVHEVTIPVVRDEQLPKG